MPTPEQSADDAVSGKIRAAMARKRIRQADVAEALGLTQVSVSDRLNGRREWRLSELRAVARLLGVPLSVLVAEDVSVEASA